MAILDDKYRVKNPHTSKESSLAKYYGSIQLLYPDEIQDILVDPIDASSYRGDFFGLLALSNIPKSLYGLNLYLNNLSSSIRYNGDTTIKLTNSSIIASLLEKLSN